MKWIDLSTTKKEVPAEEIIAVWIPDEKVPKKGHMVLGVLLRIEFVGKLKNYIFKSGDNEVDNASHYAIIEGPKISE
jgi:hypothetical protein